MIVLMSMVMMGWLVCAALYEATLRHSPWRDEITAKRGEVALVRALLPWRFGLQLLQVALGAMAVIMASVQWAYMGLWWTVPLLLTVVGLCLFVVRQATVQSWAIAAVVSLQRRWGKHLGFVPRFLQACTSLGKVLFPEYAVFASKRELAGFVRYHHRQYHTLGADEHTQVEALLRVETEPVGPLVIPLKKAAMVGSGDTVGPLLLSELHDSPYVMFAVYRGKSRSQVVGVLDQGVAVSHAKTTPKVAALMDERLVYLPQEATWQQALQTFIETSAPLSVIIDENNEPAGVLYIQDVLQAMFGPAKEDDKNHHAHSDQPTA